MSSPAIGRNAVMGGIVADAASLAFEWLYDPARIAQVAPREPEFREPNVADFEGVAGYFIGKGKQAGDVSHYAEQLVVSAKALTNGGSAWDPALFLTEFQAVFERGGTFIGYIDSCTNGTLDNLKVLAPKRAETAAGTQELSADQRKFITMQLMYKSKSTKGEKLIDAVVAAATSEFEGDAAAIAKAKAAAQYFVANPTVRAGINDNQISGLVKLPAVVAAYAGTPKLLEAVEAAVRTTNDSDEAVAFGLFYARVLEAVLLDPKTELRSAIDGALKLTRDEFNIHALVGTALKEDTRAPDAASKLSALFGSGSCPVPNTVPILIAIAATPGITFVDATRLNIYVGGDISGRAVLLGALFGAAQGVPEQWRAKVRRAAEFDAVLAAAFA